MTWYWWLAGWWVRIASIARRIVAGSGKRRTSKAAVRRAVLRWRRPRAGGGHGSAGMMPRSTARRTHARATFRYRPAVDGASGAPSSAACQTGLDGGEVLTRQFGQRSGPPREPPVAFVVQPGLFGFGASGTRPSATCCRMPSGGSTAPSRTASGTNRLRASIADARVRGCQSSHCSATHRRAHSHTVMSAGDGAHDSGSPEARSNRSPRS